MNKHLVLGLSLCFISCKSSPAEDSNLRAEEVTPASGRVGLGMNDISILLPRVTVPTLDAKLPALSDKNGEELYIPADTVDTIIESLKFRVIKFSRADFEQFKPTAIRFVPCANDFEAKDNLEACASTMQVIWQSKADRSFHTIYGISKVEFQEVIETLKDLNARSNEPDNLPLSVHPIIEKEGADGAYFQTVLKLFKKHARVSHMIGYASMQSDAQTEWSMSQFAQKDGASVPLPIPFESEKRQVFTDQAAARKALSVFSSAPVKIASIPFGGGRFGAMPTEEAVRKVKNERVAASFLIDHPGLHNIRNLDCAGCHMSFMTIPDRPKNFQAPADAFQSAHWNTANTSSTKDVSMLGLQMFSFERGVGGKPRITQRVINETAVAMDYLVKMGLLKAPEKTQAAPTK